MISGYEIQKIQLKTTNFKKIMKCFKPLLRFLGPKQNLGRALLLGGVHCYLGRALCHNKDTPAPVIRSDRSGNRSGDQKDQKSIRNRDPEGKSRDPRS